MSSGRHREYVNWLIFRYNQKRGKHMRADRLRAIREQRQLSQQDLADQIGVHVKQIGRYENNSNDPTADVLTRIAQVLEVSTDYLLGLVDEPTSHLREEDLNPMERRLLQAIRSGATGELFKILAALTNVSDQPPVTPNKPTVNR
jgi:transcriptional regulator with XRE-family HTH domain